MTYEYIYTHIHTRPCLCVCVSLSLFLSLSHTLFIGMYICAYTHIEKICIYIYMCVCKQCVSKYMCASVYMYISLLAALLQDPLLKPHSPGAQRWPRESRALALGPRPPGERGLAKSGLFCGGMRDAGSSATNSYFYTYIYTHTYRCTT